MLRCSPSRRLGAVVVSVSLVVAWLAASAWAAHPPAGAPGGLSGSARDKPVGNVTEYRTRRGRKVKIKRHGDLVEALGRERGKKRDGDAPSAPSTRVPSAEPPPGLPSSTLARSWCGEELAADDTVHEFGSPGDPKIKVVYAFAADEPNRLFTVADMVQGDVKLAYERLADDSGSTRSLRFDLGTSCGPWYLDIVTVALPGTRAYYEGAPFSRIVDDVQAALGPASATRNYLIYPDRIATPYGGQGELPQDDQPGSGNATNLGGWRALVYHGWWWEDPAMTDYRSGVILHEVGHNLGAVQDSAPHSTLRGHCWDERDIMCYDDGWGPMTLVCPGDGFDEVFDCGGDDYFNRAPPPGSYLSTHWNSFDSIFMCAVGGCTPASDPPADVSISELRLRGQAGPLDEFVELTNRDTVAYGISGWTLEACDASGITSTAAMVPAGTELKPGQSYLFKGRDFAGAADQELAVDLPDASEAGITLSTGAAAIDSVGARTSPCREGGGLTLPATNGNYAFVRRTAANQFVDTTHNIADFEFVSPAAGAFSAIQSKLGVIGAEPLSDLRRLSFGFQPGLFDPTQTVSGSNNRSFSTTGFGGQRGSQGVLRVRRAITNTGPSPITDLRLRVHRLSTEQNRNPGQADLRLIDASQETRMISGSPRSALATDFESEAQCPTGPNAEDRRCGGLNARATVQLAGNPIDPGETVYFNLDFAAEQTGSFSLFLVPEALP